MGTFCPTKLYQFAKRAAIVLGAGAIALRIPQSRKACCLRIEH